MSGGAAEPGSPGPERAGELGLREAVDAYQRAAAAASAAELAGGGDAAFHLRQAALETVIERRMAVRAVISIHRALLAGAPVTQVAQATGLSPGQVAARWAAWAGGQVRLGERTGIGMTRQEYERAAAGLPVLPDKRM